MKRVAIVHDWLTGMRGGERVLDALLVLFPQAEIFTLVHIPGSVSARIEARPIHVPALGRTQMAGRYYRYGLPIFPFLVERFDLSGFDLVISSSHCVAKGAKPPPNVPHVCYCHTPMRYVWDQFDAYFGPGRASLPVRASMQWVAPNLRRWDRASSDRVTAFVANSHHVKKRIRRFYDRDALVVPPPVDVTRFAPSDEKDDFFLYLGALVPYKRVDLVIEVFNRLGLPLVVAGDGPHKARLEAAAAPNVRFAGRVSDAEATDLLSRARALVHGGVEDFGITFVEAQASGTPVIARAAGGALETIVPSGHGDQGAQPTGVLFTEPTSEALAQAIVEFESETFETEALLANARRFSTDAFLDSMEAAIDRLLMEAGS